MTVAGGLGCCAIIGIPFNASTTQIIPFLALGLGVNSMYHLISTYAGILQIPEIPVEVSNDIFCHHSLPELLQYLWNINVSILMYL